MLYAGGRKDQDRMHRCPSGVHMTGSRRPARINRTEATSRADQGAMFRPAPHPTCQQQHTAAPDPWRGATPLLLCRPSRPHRCPLLTSLTATTLVVIQRWLHAGHWPSAFGPTFNGRLAEDAGTLQHNQQACGAAAHPADVGSREGGAGARQGPDDPPPAARRLQGLHPPACPAPQRRPVSASPGRHPP
jgi:hypothetical protein